jgi:hypothetical protein
MCVSRIAKEVSSVPTPSSTISFKQKWGCREKLALKKSLNQHRFGGIDRTRRAYLDIRLPPCRTLAPCSPSVALRRCTTFGACRPQVLRHTVCTLSLAKFSLRKLVCFLWETARVHDAHTMH